MARSLLTKGRIPLCTRRAVSSVVAETNSQLSTTQSTRSKSGPGSQSSGGDGFSGLVDDNLAASGGNDPTGTDRPRPAVRDATTTDAQATRRTAIQPRLRNQTDSGNQATSTQQSSGDASTDAASSDATATDNPADALEAFPASIRVERPARSTRTLPFSGVST